MPALELAALLRSRWTWYALGGLALVGAGWWVRHHYIEVGKEEGRAEQAEAAQKEIEAQRQAARARADAAIAEANAQIAEADARARKANAEAAVYAAQVQALAGALASGRQRVAAVPQAELHAFALAQVQQSPLPGESPDPERAVAERVVAVPLLVRQNRALAGQVEKLGETVRALQDQVGALEARDRARAAYTAQLEGWYAQLYNLHPPRKRSPKCLWLWRCARAPLPVPAPAELPRLAAVQTSTGEAR